MAGRYARAHGYTQRRQPIQRRRRAVFARRDRPRRRPEDSVRCSVSGQPQLVWSWCGELSLHVVVMNRWAGLATSTTSLGEGRPQFVLRAQSPYSPLARGESLFAELLGHEPVPESRIVGAKVVRGVAQMRLVPRSIRDRLAERVIECLFRKTQHPAGPRDGNPDRGVGRSQFTDQRIHQFFGRFACERYGAARCSTSFSCPSRRIRRFIARISEAWSSVTPGRIPSSMSAFLSQLCSVASLTPKSLAIWKSGGVVLTGDRDHVAPELRGTGFGQRSHPYTEDQVDP